MTDRREAEGVVVLRCAFCLSPNRVQVARAQDRPTCGQCQKPILLDRPVKVTEEDFERTVLQAGVPVLVDFHAEWCQPCKMLAPMIDDIARDHRGSLLVAKVDTDHAPGPATQYQIRGVPTLILFEGGEERRRSVGIMPEEIQSMVAEATGAGA